MQKILSIYRIYRIDKATFRGKHGFKWLDKEGLQLKNPKLLKTKLKLP